MQTEKIEADSMTYGSIESLDVAFLSRCRDRIALHRRPRPAPMARKCLCHQQDLAVACFLLTSRSS